MALALVCPGGVTCLAWPNGSAQYSVVVTLLPGATILGGRTVIGRGAVIGVNVWLTDSILPGTKVTIGTPEQEVVQHEARTAY